MCGHGNYKISSSIIPLLARWPLFIFFFFRTASGVKLSFGARALTRQTKTCGGQQLRRLLASARALCVQHMQLTFFFNFNLLPLDIFVYSRVDVNHPASSKPRRRRYASPKYQRGAPPPPSSILKYALTHARRRPDFQLNMHLSRYCCITDDSIPELRIDCL